MEREERRYRRRTTIKELWIEYFSPLSVKKNAEPSRNESPESEPKYDYSEADGPESSRLTPGHIPNDKAGEENGSVSVYEWQGTLGAGESARRYWLFLREQGWVD